MTENCVFCKIVDGRIKEDILYQDDDVFVVRDIHPRTSTHLLIITKQHYSNYSELIAQNPALIEKLGIVVEKMVAQFDLRNSSANGYTWGFHCGGKESVTHVHAQLLAGMKQNDLVL
jgi:histidine triad (HIT) family protein